MVPHLESVTYHTLAWATLHRHVGHSQLQTVRSDLMKLYHDPILYRYILSICVTYVLKGVPEKVWEHYMVCYLLAVNVGVLVQVTSPGVQEFLLQAVTARDKESKNLLNIYQLSFPVS